MVSARRLEDQRLHEDEDVFGIAAARVGKFLRPIQTKRMGWRCQMAKELDTAMTFESAPSALC